MKPVQFLCAAVLFTGLGSLHAEGVRKVIQFPKGQSSATLAASVVRGDTDRYDITANAGQTMTVSVSSKEKNAAFTIYQPGYRTVVEDGVPTITGPTLAGAGEGDDAMKWTGPLPAAGKYLIEVGGTRGNASYKLTVTIK